MTEHPDSPLLRHRGDAGDGKVGFIELFFDLIFVFATAQLSHLLLSDLSGAGAIRTLMLFLAVWWVWICTTWTTNYLATDHVANRLLIFAIMLLGLLMSTSIPLAFGDRALSFAVAVAAIQVGRTAYLAWALRASPPQCRNFTRVAIWFAAAALFWIAGGLADGEQRLLFWTIALAIELTPAFFGFWLPRLGRSSTRDWNLSTEHMAERCGLFVIIALGEMIMISGGTFSGLEWSTPVSLAFLAAAIAAIAMWWIYFNLGAERAARAFGHSEDPGVLARGAYTYAHMPLVAGIVLMAVAIELALEHPLGHAGPPMVWSAAGAAGLFLLGNHLFKRATAGWFPFSHWVGLGAVIALAFAAPMLSPLAVLAATAGILVTVAAWETISLGSAHGTEEGAGVSAA